MCVLRRKSGENLEEIVSSQEEGVGPQDGGGDEAGEGGTVAGQVEGGATCPERKILSAGLINRENHMRQNSSPHPT